MRFGFGIPHAEAATSGPEITRFVQRLEALGFEPVCSPVVG